jgi:hypothetical protein
VPRTSIRAHSRTRRRTLRITHDFMTAMQSWRKVAGTWNNDDSLQTFSTCQMIGDGTQSWSCLVSRVHLDRYGSGILSLSSLMDAIGLGSQRFANLFDIMNHRNVYC